jgi:hypothetical protein
MRKLLPERPNEHLSRRPLSSGDSVNRAQSRHARNGTISCREPAQSATAAVTLDVFHLLLISPRDVVKRAPVDRFERPLTHLINAITELGKGGIALRSPYARSTKENTLRELIKRYEKSPRLGCVAACVPLITCSRPWLRISRTW